MTWTHNTRSGTLADHSAGDRVGTQNHVGTSEGATLNDTTRVFMVLIGCIVFCVAIVGTIESFHDGGSGNGADAGGLAMGIGLAMILVPWLPDRARSSESEVQDELAPAPTSPAAD